MSNQPNLRNPAQQRSAILRTRPAKAILAVAATLLAMAGNLQQAQAAQGGAVYVLSNQEAGNAVQVYHRDADGTLSFSSSIPTGGLGTIATPIPGGAAGIDPLASQGSVVYTKGLLLAANAGSNEISLFRANGDSLELVDKVPSGGVRPTSISVRGSLVYVVNAAGTPNVTAFRLDRDHGRLRALPNSTVGLPGGTKAAPGEVAIGPDGETLFVTEKGTNTIDSFDLDGAGYASGAKTITAPGQVPFGFDITRRGYLVVAEAGSGSASSYDIEHDATLKVISSAVSLQGQTAPCWVITTPDGRYAYTGNAGTQTIGSYAVGGDGALTLITGAAAALGASALDLGITRAGDFLYVREALGSNPSLPGDITGFHVEADGSLTRVNTVVGVPPGAQGIAVQ